jgi:hypothetical protein
MVSFIPWVCRYLKKSLMPTAYCLTTNLLQSVSKFPIQQLDYFVFYPLPFCSSEIQRAKFRRSVNVIFVDPIINSPLKFCKNLSINSLRLKGYSC